MSILENLSRVEIETKDTAFVVIQSANSELLLVATPEDPLRTSMLIRGLCPNISLDIKVIEFLLYRIKLAMTDPNYEKYISLSMLITCLVYVLRMVYNQFHPNRYYCIITMDGNTVMAIQLHDRQNGTLIKIYELGWILKKNSEVFQ